MDRNKALQIIADNEGHLTPSVCADLWMTWDAFEKHEPLTEGNMSQIIAAVMLAMRDQEIASYAAAGRAIAAEVTRYIRSVHADDISELRDAA